MLSVVAEELGLRALLSSPRDVHLLIAQRTIRLIAYGQSTLVLASLLHALGTYDFRIGLFMTLTLFGDVAASIVLTRVADQTGRRRILLLGCGLMCLSGLVFSWTSSFWLLLLAAMAGVITPNGNEIGPFKAVEESILAGLVHQDDRSTIFAWYAAISGFGASVGSLSAGWIIQRLTTSFAWGELSAYRLIFGFYSALALMKAGLTMGLSEACELSPAVKEQRIAPETERMLETETTTTTTRRSVMARVLNIQSKTLSKLRILALLFGLDNFASGLVPLSFVIYFFQTKFSLEPGTLGTTFFTTSAVAATSNLFAAALSRRIGNARTMAFTHLPSAIFLGLIPLPNGFGTARLFLFLRFCTAQMDGAPRSAFVSGYVPDSDRTTVMGIINVIKTVSQSTGPIITGRLAEAGLIRFSFFAAGAMKASYDMMVLYFLTIGDK